MNKRYEEIVALVRDTLVEAGSTFRPDKKAAYQKAIETETNEKARSEKREKTEKNEIKQNENNEKECH